MENVIYIDEEEAWQYRYENHVDLRIGDEHRWHTDKYVVFERDGKYYEFCQMDPSTEYQEGQDEYFEIPIPCYEVKPEEKTVVIYKRV